MSKAISAQSAATAAFSAEQFSAPVFRRGSYQLSNPMTALTKRGSAMSSHETVTGDSVMTRGIIGTLIIVPMLLTPLAAVAWLSWILADGMLGTQRAALTALVPLAATAAFSWRTGRSFACSLIMVGFGAITSLTAALFAVVGYVLIFGERALVIWQP
jgi:hypothetical protein